MPGLTRWPYARIVAVAASGSLLLGTGDVTSAPVAPAACPTAYAEQRVHFEEIGLRSIVVRSVDPRTLVLRGVLAGTAQPVLVQLCRTTSVDDRPGALSRIRPSDLAYTYELRNRDGVAFATKVAVNTYTAIVRIGRPSPASMDMTVVDDHMLVPVTRLYPLYTGVVPSLGRFSAESVVEWNGRAIAPARLPVGRYAKIYGRKAPSSRVIDIARVEVLRGTAPHGGPR
jgi:hypothetical protein